MLKTEQTTQWYFSDERKAVFEKASLQERITLIQSYLQDILNHTFEDAVKREGFQLRCYYFAVFLADAIYGSVLPYAEYPALIDPTVNPFVAYWVKTKNFDTIKPEAVQAAFLSILKNENDNLECVSTTEIIRASIEKDGEAQGLSEFFHKAIAKMPVPQELTIAVQLRPIALKIMWLCDKIVGQELVAVRQSEKEKKQLPFFRAGVIFAAVLVVLAILISIFAPIDRSKFVKNTDGRKISLSLIKWESVQEPVAEFDISIENGFDRDLAGLDIELQFYDGDNELIQTTTLNLSGYMPAQEKKTLTVKLHNDVVDALYWYSTEEIGITANITGINFNDTVNADPPIDNGKRVLKDAQKPDESKQKGLEDKLDAALAKLKDANAQGAIFDSQVEEVGSAFNEIWEDVIRDQSLLEKIYQEAVCYEQSKEYEKAYILFGLLSVNGYEDSEQRAYACALAVNGY